MVEVILPGSMKRHEPSELFDGPHHKKRKMDNGIKIECKKTIKPKISVSKIVKKLVGLNAKKTEDTVKPSISFEEKMRLKKKLMVALRGDVSGPLRGFLRKYGLVSSNKDKIESVFGLFDVGTLLELKGAMKGCLGTSIEKGNNDHVHMLRTKDTMEIQKLEAARAAKEAILMMRAKSDLQMRRAREREQVEKMERTVSMGDNLAVLMELEKLCKYSGIKNTLEKIGLRLKDEHCYGDEYIDDDGGVIFDELEGCEIL